MDTLRVFVWFCETVDAVPADLHSKIISPTLSDGTGQRAVKLDSGEAEALLDYLGRFENPKRLREKWAGADSNRNQRFRLVASLLCGLSLGGFESLWLHVPHLTDASLSLLAL